VAEGARLESVYTFTGIGGSNPSLSAIILVICHLHTGDLSSDPNKARRISPRGGLLSSKLGLSKWLYFPSALGARQELRHLLVFGSVVRPPFRGGVPAII
jgi:hypothetical protein